MNTTPHPSSFRDPSGHIFEDGGVLYRQINRSYSADYEQLKTSGLLAKLVSQKLLVPHQEEPIPPGIDPSVYMIIKPERIAPISYCSEWNFDALKDAALLHLEVMKLSVKHDMILKDATPYNVQFKNGHPLLIDTLSFQRYDEQIPWIAYRQFCSNFLYPLLLEHYKVLYAHEACMAFPDGLPAAVIARLLPARSRLSLGCWLHVYMASSVVGQTTRKQETIFSRTKMTNLVNHLHGFISGLKPNNKSAAAWNTYYHETILSQQYLEDKKRIFNDFIKDLPVKRALDLGCNDGHFSKLLAEKGIEVIAVDNDAPSVNNLYLQNKTASLNLLPLIVDIGSPTPATGFTNTERSSFLQRLEVDLIIALALIHHLVIGRNIPMYKLALLFSEQAKWLLIEFVPKDDPKVQQMLLNREDIFHNYTTAEFETVFGLHFELAMRQQVPGTSRIIYLYKRRMDF